MEFKLTRKKCMDAKTLHDIAKPGEYIELSFYDNPYHPRIAHVLKLIRSRGSYNLTIKQQAMEVNPYITVEGYYTSYCGFNDTMIRELLDLFKDNRLLIYKEVIDSDPWGFHLDGELNIMDRWETSPGG